MYIRGFKRYHVRCVKCGYEWMAYKENPVRCASCNNPDIDKPKKRDIVRCGEVVINEEQPRS